MPDLREWLLLVLVGGGALLGIAWPLLGPRRPEASPDPDREARVVRHRVALESLRDVEADHRAGLLDEASYLAQRAEAEARAARTLAELEAVPPTRTGSAAVGGARLALGIASILVALLLVGFALPRPVGIGEATATNQALAQARAAEAARQAQIATMLDRLGTDPRDTDALSQLADAYLSGSTADDLQRGAVALLALIGLEPDNASAYRRLITAYINVGDWTDARSATDSFAEVVGADDPDAVFFRGLIALRGDDDRAAAVSLFDRFLELAPDDPRGSMIRSLRAEAAGELPSESP